MGELTWWGDGLVSNTSVCCAMRFLWLIIAALGSPVVPLLNSRAAVVLLHTFSSLKRTQSSSPCFVNSFQERKPVGKGWFCVSKIHIFDEGILQSFAAAVRFSRISGSEMRNFVFAVLRWWVSSDWVYAGLVPLKTPPAPMTARKTME